MHLLCAAQAVGTGDIHRRVRRDADDEFLGTGGGALAAAYALFAVYRGVPFVADARRVHGTGVRAAPHTETAPGTRLAPAAEQFLLSQMAGVGLARALGRYAEGVQVKWPNDIYWHDRKLAGILIEHALNGPHIRHTVVGFGLNVNQTVFFGGFAAVSLRQMTGESLDRKSVLDEVVRELMDVYQHWDAGRVREEYMRLLWRREGFHPYEDAEGLFEARIVSVESDGRLRLEDRNGRVRGYYMKEVKAITDGMTE